jgi:D-3-phosphoglycerate dehydrogenase
MDKKKILVSVTNYLEFCSKGKEMLEDFGCDIVATEKNGPYDHDELKSMIKDFDAAVVGCDIWNEEIFSAAPRLKALARFGIGVDNIDLKAAEKHKVQVTNCRGINSNSVAEHALTLMLSMIRKIPNLDSSTRDGEWERVIIHEINYFKIGLVGFGGIAQKVAEKLKPFGSQIFAYDAYPNTAAAENLGVTMCDLDTLLETCDLLSLHVPALPETRHLINPSSIEKIKDGAYLINTARGMIVDEMAVYNGLNSGKLSGYATDVFETDPVNKNNPLLKLDNFICTPHIAAESYENYDQTGIETAQAIIDILSGKEPKNLLV